MSANSPPRTHGYNTRHSDNKRPWANLVDTNGKDYRIRLLQGDPALMTPLELADRESAFRAANSVAARQQPAINNSQHIAQAMPPGAGITDDDQTDQGTDVTSDSQQRQQQQKEALRATPNPHRALAQRTRSTSPSFPSRSAQVADHNNAPSCESKGHMKHASGQGSPSWPDWPPFSSSPSIPANVNEDASYRQLRLATTQKPGQGLSFSIPLDARDGHPLQLQLSHPFAASGAGGVAGQMSPGLAQDTRITVGPSGYTAQQSSRLDPSKGSPAAAKQHVVEHSPPRLDAVTPNGSDCRVFHALNVPLELDDMRAAMRVRIDPVYVVVFLALVASLVFWKLLTQLRWP